MKLSSCVRTFFLTSLLAFISMLSKAQSSFVSEQNGTITVRTEGTDKKVNNAISDAEKYVFYIVFYRGIPGSSLKTGLIDIPETEAEQKYMEYFDAFYKSRYQTFITTTVFNGAPIKGKHKQKSVFHDVTINIDALKKDLEQNNVIRKFGF